MLRHSPLLHTEQSYTRLAHERFKQETRRTNIASAVLGGLFDVVLVLLVASPESGSLPTGSVALWARKTARRYPGEMGWLSLIDWRILDAESLSCCESYAKRLSFWGGSWPNWYSMRYELVKLVVENTSNTWSKDCGSEYLVLITQAREYRE